MRVGHHHAGQHRLHRLRHQRLQRIALQRHAHAGHRHHHAGVAGRDHRDLAGGDPAARRLDRVHRAGRRAADRGHLAVLDDVDAERARGARIAPGHRVMPRHAAAALQGGTQDRMAQVGRDVQRRTERLRLLRRQPLVVDAVQPVGMHVALEHLHIVHRMRQHHHAARRIHHVVVQFLRQPFPQLQRMLVQRGALIPQIVGADDRGVAPGVAAAEPAALQHRDIAHAMLARKVVRRGQAVAAGADDHHVVRRAAARASATAPARRHRRTAWRSRL